MPRSQIIVLAHNIRSAYNVGSFFRTADAAGAEKIVLSGYSARPPHHGVAKVALGAEGWLPWEYVRQPGAWMVAMKKHGWQVIALERCAGSRNLFSVRPRQKVIMVLGNEVRGISPALRRQCDLTAEIPMIGRKESLNVASAMAIAVYYLGWLA